MGARHRFARHKHIRASGQRSANDLGRTNSRRNKAGAQYCFSCTSICRFVFSTISICLANNTFNLFYPFCSSLHSCTRTLPRQCCHSMEGQFFAVPIAYAGKFVVFPALTLLEAGTLYFWKFCDAHISLQEKHFLTWCHILHPRFAEFVKLLREAIFLFFFGFLIPFCALMTLLLNTPHF